MRANAMSKSPIIPRPSTVASCYQLDRRLDQEARVQISYELGHGRIDVVSAYIGGRA